MNHKRILFLGTTVMAFFIGYRANPNPRTAFAKQSETVQIIAGADRSLTLEFSVPTWMVDTTEVSGNELFRFDFKGANSNYQPGKPQVPYHVAVLGIPAGARVQYNIIEADFVVERDATILPFARPTKMDGIQTAAYVLDKAIYEGQTAFPAQLVQVDEPAYFRNQQICRIQVAAIQYLPGTKEVRRYNRIVLQVNFVGGQSNIPPLQAHTSSEETLFRKALLNYSEAKKWRRPKRQPGLPKSQSLFSRNDAFYQIKVREEGMYRIDGQFLQSLNIDLSQIDPANIRLFNNGGRELPRDLTALRPNGLVENAIIVQDGGDASFDANDFILFYGKGVEGWKYDLPSRSYAHYINHYGFDNVYWLSLDGSEQGKRMREVDGGQQGGALREEYQGLLVREEELDNPLRSGLNWFGRQFAIDEISGSQTFRFDLPNAVGSSTDRVKLRFISRTPGSHRFDITLNDSQAKTHQFIGVPFELGGVYVVMTGSQTEATFPNQISSGSNSLQLSYSHNLTSGQALLDWFELFYSARLSAREDELAFNVIPESGQVSYRVTDFSSDNTEVFDVTDFANVKRFINTSKSNGSVTFSDLQNVNAPKRYLSLIPAKYKSVESLERVDVRDLRGAGLGAEFIIITHDDFQVEAQRLESLRENGNPDNRLDTEVVLISEIYNNFSAGQVDPVAIRDFLRFAVNNWSPTPSYVLLLGDGDYDFKNIIGTGDKNWIPPFQTDEFDFRTQTSRPTLRELESRTTDSWFTYVVGNDIVMDMAIGRINAQSLEDARNAIDNIVSYETRPLRGNWRNTVTVVGDDELVGGGRASAQDDVHIMQIEAIAEQFIPESFDIEKIYLPEFPKVVSASVGGIRKPAAQEALLRQMNKGTLIVNFVGHGNDRVWAHEVVFEQADNDRVQNAEKLIFFVAATCDWALFDNPQRQSQAEELLLLENRGAIAILSSARLVFSFSNFRYNQFYYLNLFEETGATARIGDAFMLARMSTNQQVNDEKFHIYGDPTLRLATPRHEAVITSITPDSILALNTMEVSGEVRIDGSFASDFNGKALVNTFDSKKFVQNFPEAGRRQDYFLPGNSIYRGAVPVENGRFTARFIVPKDISYGGNRARISTYFWNDESDGAGSQDNILVSSSSSDLADSEGPRIQIYFRGQENFITGDIIGENVTLVVDLADSVSGINIAGEIGHRLTLQIDPDEETCIALLNQFRGVTITDLTDLFQFREGDHLSGTVEFPLTFPKEVDIAGSSVDCVGPDGEDRHTLVVKAWDNSNNSTTASVEVLIAHEQGFVLQDVLNYPNPFRDNTTFTFIANRDAEVTIKIYTISGQLVHTLEYPLARSGFNMVEWDGRDADGDIPANGVYLYKVIARAPGDDSALVQREVIGRMAIIR